MYQNVIYSKHYCFSKISLNLVPIGKLEIIIICITLIVVGTNFMF
jgi:hypothetical protein